MFGFLVKRVLAVIPVMAVVGLFVFSLLFLAPGDPAALIAGDQASPADIERIRASLGLDRPFLVRFGEWAWRILHGDLGTSIFTNLPVTTMIGQRVQPTVSLMLVTLIFAVLVAVPLGVLAAWKAGRLVDRLVMGGRCSASRCRSSSSATSWPMSLPSNSAGCRRKATRRSSRGSARGSPA